MENFIFCAALSFSYGASKSYCAHSWSIFLAKNLFETSRICENWLYRKKFCSLTKPVLAMSLELIIFQWKFKFLNALPHDENQDFLTLTKIIMKTKNTFSLHFCRRFSFTSRVYVQDCIFDSGKQFFCDLEKLLT